MNPEAFRLAWVSISQLIGTYEVESHLDRGILRGCVLGWRQDIKKAEISVGLRQHPYLDNILHHRIFDNDLSALSYDLSPKIT